MKSRTLRRAGAIAAPALMVALAFTGTAALNGCGSERGTPRDDVPEPRQAPGPGGGPDVSADGAAAPPPSPRPGG